MSLRHSILISSIALGVAAGARSTPARAADAPAESPEVEQARKHFAQGLKLYKDGDFDAALVQFERAYSIKVNFKVLYNIAQCYFELHRYVEARDALSRYLKDGEGNVDAERKAAVESDLAELEHRIAHLKLSVNVNGATVYVDGRRVGVTPLPAALDVNEGERSLSIETSDRGSKQRVVRLAGGEEQAVRVDFEAPGVGTTAAPSGGDRKAAPRSHGLGAGFWVTGIGALALGAGAGVTGFLTLHTQSERDDDLKRFGVTTRELDDSSKKAKRLALATDVLAGSAVLCAGIATVLLITHDSGSEQVGLTLGPANVALRGRF